MKEELRKILTPYIEQLDEVKVDKRRIEEARANCVARKGYNGCWNCDENNSGCAINETRQIVEAKARLMYYRIATRVSDWLNTD